MLLYNVSFKHFIRGNQCEPACSSLIFSIVRWHFTGEVLILCGNKTVKWYPGVARLQFTLAISELAGTGCSADPILSEVLDPHPHPCPLHLSPN